MPPLVPSARRKTAVLHDKKAELFLFGALFIGKRPEALKLDIAVALFLFAADVYPVYPFCFQTVGEIVAVKRVPSRHLFGTYRIAGPADEFAGL